MSCFCERKLKNDSGAAFRYFYTQTFDNCCVRFPYKEILSFLGHCHATLPYMEPLSFFGRFVQKVIYLVFQVHLLRKRRNNQIAAVLLQVIPSFYTIYSKSSLFISANSYEKFIVSKEYCIDCHDDKMCFLPICRYHIIAIGNIKDLLQKLDAFCFNYQDVDCMYTLFKCHFNGKIVIESGQFFDNLQRAVQVNQKKHMTGQNAQHREKETLEEKVQETFVELLPRDQIEAY